MDPESIRLVAPDLDSANALRQMLPGAWTQVRELGDGPTEITLDVAAAELATALDVVQRWVDEQRIPSVSVWVGADERVFECQQRPS